MSKGQEAMKKRADELRRHAQTLKSMAAIETREFTAGGRFIEFNDPITPLEQGAAALRAMADTYDRTARLPSRLADRLPNG